MNDLQITEKSIKVRTGTVVFTDYERIKAEATDLAELISSTEVSEENIKLTKKMLASLNKSVEELESKRIAIKKAILTQYNVFEGQIKDIVKIVKDADTVVRQQVRDLEEIEREAKRDEIGVMWDQRIQHYTFKDILSFEDFLESSDLNKSVPLSKVEARMAAWLDERDKDITAIGTLPDNSAIMVEYVSSRNLAQSMQIVTARKEQESRIAAVISSQHEAEETEKTYMFIITNEKDAILTEMLLKENKINYKKVEN